MPRIDPQGQKCEIDDLIGWLEDKDYLETMKNETSVVHALATQLLKLWWFLRMKYLLQAWLYQTTWQ